MDLPNEVVFSILNYLPQKDLKQSRLACKDFASLGGRLLIGTLHVSPRDADMVVFHNITRHPDLSKSVKNLFFDTARFCKYDSMLDYGVDLRRQLLAFDYWKLRKNNAAVRNLTRVVRGPKTRNRGPFDETDLERCRRNPTFCSGYQEYCRLAEQQQNVDTLPWFHRVFVGMATVGPIHAVTVGSTFEMRLDRHAESDEDDDDYGKSIIYDLPEDRWSKKYDGNRDNITGRASCIQLSVNDLVAGKRAVGSPIARQWPFTSLQPRPTKCMQAHERANSEDPTDNGIFDGTLPFLYVIQLMNLTRKWPSFFGLMANASPGSGILSNLFDLQWPCDTPSLDGGNRLTVLRLKVNSAAPLPHTLDRLKALFHDSSNLQELTLDLPTHDTSFPCKHFEFSQVFPPVTEWSLFKLRCLKLSGLRVSTQNLLGFLLISLPNLRNLELNTVKLTDGKWNHTVAGLRTQTSIEEFVLLNDILWTGCHSGPPCLVIDQNSRRCLARVLRALGELHLLYKEECKARDRCSHIIDQLRDTLRTDSAEGDMQGSEDDDDDDKDDDDDEEDDVDQEDYDDAGDIDDWDSDEEKLMAARMASSYYDTSTDGETD
ncbi:MAG: hypothetical protein LQ346_008349 [Caloplaca aetnensis]|nr:MAG: hypothetical protein LQ346_008349 [Caloplaca aetnensis]